MSYREIAAKYGVHRGTPLRHNKHREKVSHAPTIVEGSAIDRIEAALRYNYAELKKLEAKPNSGVGARAIHSQNIVQLLKTKARLTGELDDPKQALRVAFGTPEFQTFVRDLVGALKPIPGALEAAQAALKAFEAAVVS